MMSAALKKDFRPPVKSGRISCRRWVADWWRLALSASLMFPSSSRCADASFACIGVVLFGFAFQPCDESFEQQCQNEEDAAKTRICGSRLARPASPSLRYAQYSASIAKMMLQQTNPSRGIR